MDRVLSFTKELIYKNIFIVIFLNIIFIMYLCSVLGIIPNPAQVLLYLEDLYNNYGLLILFIIALIEGFLFFGLYFNGFTLIILAVFIARGDIVQILKIVLTVGTALSIVNTINFIIGRYSMNFKKKTKIKERKHKYMYFIHPTLIAYYSIRLGQAKKSFKSLFYVFIGIFLSGAIYSIIITIFSKFILS